MAKENSLTCWPSQGAAAAGSLAHSGRTSHSSYAACLLPITQIGMKFSASERRRGCVHGFSVRVIKLDGYYGRSGKSKKLRGRSAAELQKGVQGRDCRSLYSTARSADTDPSALDCNSSHSRNWKLLGLWCNEHNLNIDCHKIAIIGLKSFQIAHVLSLSLSVLVYVCKLIEMHYLDYRE